MKTLVDRFELGSQTAPAEVPATNDAVDADGDQKADFLSPKVARSDSWARARCWCSED